MVTTTKFCLPADVSLQMNNRDGYTGDDAAITAHIKQATALVRSFTRRTWERGTFTQFFDTQQINTAFQLGRSVARFSLKEKPLQSITSIKFNTGGDWEATAELRSDLWTLDGNSIIIYPSQMHYHQRSLRVVYIAGHPINDTDAELLDVPENLKQAVAIQAAYQWRRVINETSGKKQKQDQKGFANYSITSSGLVGEALALIKGDTTPLLGRHG